MITNEAGLTLSHKICREVLLEELGVLEGIVQLRVGHAARFKPAVKHLVHAPQHPLALPAGDGQVVDEVPVQVRHLPEHVTMGLNTSQQISAFNMLACLGTATCQDTAMAACAMNISGANNEVGLVQHEEEECRVGSPSRL